MEDNAKDNEQAVQAIYDHVSNELILKERKSWEVRKELMDEGASEEVANTIINAVKKNYNAEIRKRGHKNMAIGGLWCAGGTIVTVYTLMASSGGGGYVVAWGAIIFGAIQFFQGYNITQKVIY